MTKDDLVAGFAAVVAVGGLVLVDYADRQDRAAPACPQSVRSFDAPWGKAAFRDGPDLYETIYPIGRDATLLQTPAGGTCLYRAPGNSYG